MAQFMDFKLSGNLAEQVQEYLSDKIIKFEIKPGERLLEEKIASELGMSRGPVREALRTLDKIKLVELIPRRGAKVTELTHQYIEWISEIILELMIILVRR